MALKKFKDLPDTDTPLNAENLNNNFYDLENKINELNKEVEDSKAKIDLLFNGNINSDSSTANLSSSIYKYDLIVLVTRSDTGSSDLFRLNTTVIPTSLISDGGTNYNIPMSASHNGVLNISERSITTQSGFSAYYGLMRVYGVKI